MFFYISFSKILMSNKMSTIFGDITKSTGFFIVSLSILMVLCVHGLYFRGSFPVNRIVSSLLRLYCGDEHGFCAGEAIKSDLDAQICGDLGGL
jgi:hypothetical protein